MTCPIAFWKWLWQRVWSDLTLSTPHGRWTLALIVVQLQSLTPVTLGTWGGGAVTQGMLLLLWAGINPHCSLSCKSVCLVQSLCSERRRNESSISRSSVGPVSGKTRWDSSSLSVHLSIILSNAPQSSHSHLILIWKLEILLMKCLIFFNQLLQLGTITTLLKPHTIKCWFPKSRWGSCLYTGHKIHRSVKTSWNIRSLKHFCWRNNEFYRF